MTRSTRLRAPAAPSYLHAMRPALGAAQSGASWRLMAVARALLTVTVVSGFVVVVLRTAGAGGHAGLNSIEGRDAWGMNLALLVGFAIAAWRPERNAAGLMPIASIAALITVVISVLTWPSTEVSMVGELSHLPIVIGALGSVLAVVASGRSTPTR